jgi:hypothetical protein
MGDSPWKTFVIIGLIAYIIYWYNNPVSGQQHLADLVTWVKSLFGQATTYVQNTNLTK